MRIEENKVYMFTFATEHGDIAIPVRGESQSDAADKLQQMFSKFQIEIAMEVPKVSNTHNLEVEQQKAVSAGLPLSAIPAEVLEMRIDVLLSDLGAGQLKGKAKFDIIKKWTNYEVIEENYPKIITELELIQSGTKEIPKK
jgi:hypothetical protein